MTTTEFKKVIIARVKTGGAYQKEWLVFSAKTEDEQGFLAKDLITINQVISLQQQVVQPNPQAPQGQLVQVPVAQTPKMFEDPFTSDEEFYVYSDSIIFSRELKETEPLYKDYKEVIKQRKLLKAKAKAEAEVLAAEEGEKIVTGNMPEMEQ